MSTAAEGQDTVDEGEKAGGREESVDGQIVEGGMADKMILKGSQPGPATTSKSRHVANGGRSNSKSNTTTTKAKRTVHNDQCGLCGMEMAVSNISRHYKTCHSPGHQFPCRYCACRFEIAYGRQVHEIRNHQPIMIATGHILQPEKSTAVNVKKKLVHVKPASRTTVIESQSLVGTMVDERKIEPGSESQNVQQTVNKPYKCNLCNFAFSFRNNLTRHMRTCHTGNDKFICPTGCGCSMQSEASLRIHMNRICSRRRQYQRSRKSPISIKVSETTSHQRIHPPIAHSNPALTVIPVKPVAAAASNSNFATSNVLKEKYLHLEVSPGVYRCEHCSKTITGSGNFRDHNNIHAKIKAYKCPRCYMRFSFKSNIKRHLGTSHVANGSLKCPMKCGCMMNNKFALQSHLNKCKTEIVKYRKNQLGQQETTSTKFQLMASTASFPEKCPDLIRQPSSAICTIIPRPPPLTPAPTFSSSRSRINSFSVATERDQLEADLKLSNPVRAIQIQDSPAGAQRHKSQRNNSYSRSNGGQGHVQQPSHSYYETNSETLSSYQNEEVGGMDVGDGYVHIDGEYLDEGEGDDMEYQYYGGCGEQFLDEDDDYINAGDHLEIIQETYDDVLDYGVELGTEEYNSQTDHDWTYSGGTEMVHLTDIYCKGCDLSFDSGDSFVYHIENNPTSGSRKCSYCCVKCRSGESLAFHIHQMHSMDEINFIESLV